MSGSIRLSVVAAASTSSDHFGTTVKNTLIVVQYPGEDKERIYWKGERLNGTIDDTQPANRSTTIPHFTMLIDGQPVVFGTGDIDRASFPFRGETLYVIPDPGFASNIGFEVDYDAEADRPVWQ